MIKLKLLRRLKAPTPLLSRALEVITGIAGVTTGVAVNSGALSITGDQVTDIVLIICVTLIVIITGEAQVPDEFKAIIDRDN